MRKEIHLKIELGAGKECDINLGRLPHPRAAEVNLLDLQVGACS